MTPDQAATSFIQALPHVQLLTPSSPDFQGRRETRGQLGQEKVPLGIAVPKDAKQVADIVRWANLTDVAFSVRTGGNDFYGRNVLAGGLVVDMRELDGVIVSDDKKTATVGGGIIAKDLIYRLEEEGLVAPAGNTWIVGYVGWATQGGYGPWTGPLGMGFEGIIGAQLVNGKGEIVEASDEMLEGLRGMGGNLGVITSLTIKVYPSTKLLTGLLVLDATLENVKAVNTTENTLGTPKGLTLHHFIMKMPDPALGILYTWADPDVEKGQGHLDRFIGALPPIGMNTVNLKSTIQHYETMPIPCQPWGGQRSVYLRRMTPRILDILMESVESMPAESNMAWSGNISLEPTSVPTNCFGADSHVFLSFSYMVAAEKDLPSAETWNEALYEKLRSCDDDAILEGSYPALTPPGDRNAAQLFGHKWKRAQELKAKFDPKNIFRSAVPQMEP